MAKIDVSTHFLVPKHELLDKKEREELFKKYSISEEDLPRIKHNDAGISKLDASVGDVIKVTRNSSLGGVINYYRLVE